MNIPTPAALKKQLDEKRASESTRQDEASSAPSRGSKSTASLSTKSPAPTADASPSKEQPKKPFVRKEHLTQRPLLGDSDLQELKTKLEAQLTSEGHKYRRGYVNSPKRGGKTAAVKNNKENN